MHLHTKVIFFILLALLIFVYLIKLSFSVSGDDATMIAGFWSAVATLIVGVIALRQNQRYKVESDKANTELKDVQAKLTAITQEMSSSIQTLQRIEHSKYYPDIEEYDIVNFSLKSAQAEEIRDSDIKNVFQFNYLDMMQNNLLERMYNEDFSLLNEFSTFCFCLRNKSEKTIRNFILQDISLNKTILNSTRTYCDIYEGQIVWICFVNMPNYEEISGSIISASFTMQNQIGEKYEGALKIFFLYEDSFPNCHIEIEYPSRV